MNALIIKKQWLDEIFSGKKIWEIRGSNTKIRGKIGLIQSGSGLIVGECELIDCFEIDDVLYKNSYKFHAIQNTEIMPYKKTYAWVLSNPIKYKTPIKYKHPNGAIIWVKL